MLATLDSAVFTPPRTRHPVPAHYRQRPRVALDCGRTVALAIHLSTELATATALDLACSLARSARTRVSIPVSGPLDDLPGQVGAALSRTGGSPDQLELVVSSGALQECGIDTLIALSALRDEGTGIALAGAGASRMELLPRLPLSALVLTPAAIRDLPGSKTALLALRSLLQAAGALSIRVIATGIASESQRAILSGLGVLEGEGPMFGAAPPPSLGFALASLGRI